MHQHWIPQLVYKFAARLLDEEERFIPIIIPCEDEPRHTDESPFCNDRLCPCHYDQKAYGAAIDRPYEEGLLTYEEGKTLYRGGNI